MSHHQCPEWLLLRRLWPAALLPLRQGRPHLQTHKKGHLSTTTPPPEAVQADSAACLLWLPLRQQCHADLLPPQKAQSHGLHCSTRRDETPRSSQLQI